MGTPFHMVEPETGGSMRQGNLQELKHRIAAMLTTTRAGICDATLEVRMPDGMHYQIVNAVYPQDRTAIVLIAREFPMPKLEPGECMVGGHPSGCAGHVEQEAGQ
jgi:hypothetical protein